MTLILLMNTQFGQGSAGTAHLCSTWCQLGWLEAGGWIIWRLAHSYVWCRCWLQAETSIGLSNRMPICGLSKWLLASSQHGGWVPRASAPGESHVEAITPFTTQPWKSRSVTSTRLYLLEAITKVGPHSRRRDWTLPLFFFFFFLRFVYCLDSTSWWEEGYRIYSHAGKPPQWLTASFPFTQDLGSCPSQCPVSFFTGSPSYQLPPSSAFMEASPRERACSLWSRPHQGSTALCMGEEFCAPSHWKKWISCQNSMGYKAQRDVKWGRGVFLSH